MELTEKKKEMLTPLVADAFGRVASVVNSWR